MVKAKKQVEAGESPKKGGKKGGKEGGGVQKAKNGVKRPTSAYIYFSNAKREEVKAANPDMAPKDIMRELGAMWKALNDKAKKPFLDMAAKDKQRYVSPFFNVFKDFQLIGTLFNAGEREISP